MDILQNTNDLQAITSKIVDLKQKFAKDTISLGLALCEAKKLVPHGQWGKYLETQVEFSQRTANQLMRVAEIFGDRSKWKSISTLNSTKLILISSLSEADREKVLDMPDIDEVSTRTLRERISAVQHHSRETSSAREQFFAAFGDPDLDYEDEAIVEISDLRVLPDYDRYFPPRTGREWIKFLQYVEHGKYLLPVRVTRDLTVVDGYERCRAYKDLGIDRVRVWFHEPIPVEIIAEYERTGKNPDYVKMNYRIWTHWCGHNSMSDYCNFCFALEDKDYAKAKELWEYYLATHEQKDKKMLDHMESKVYELMKDGTLSNTYGAELLDDIAEQRKMTVRNLSA